MALFFTADTHFGDHRTINIHRRPFARAQDMDKAIIANWNAVVSADDEVWHLGDVARRSADVPELLVRLNGTKHLVRGNNDEPVTAAARGWTTVQDYAELTVDGVMLAVDSQAAIQGPSSSSRKQSFVRLTRRESWVVNQLAKS